MSLTTLRKGSDIWYRLPLGQLLIIHGDTTFILVNESGPLISNGPPPAVQP